MRRMTTLGMALAAGLTMWVGAATAQAADGQTELQLKPCTIELVDGTTVEGQLAVQFALPDHLIVYSPRLATVRSFLKEHVHALTVNGQRKQLNPKRSLTDRDKQLLGQVDWPAEPPAEGFKPAYTTETWNKPEQLLVWAKPGKSGRFGTSGNWLCNGEPMKQMTTHQYMFKKRHGRPATDATLTPRTDVLFPAAAEDYQVRAHGRSSRYVARHVTAENNARFHHNLSGLYGNLWVAQDGRFDGGGNAPFRGEKHTFIRNGLPRPGTEPITDPQKLETKHLARKWELRKDDPGASMQIIGSVRSGDETHVIRGRLIVSENSTVDIGARCTQTIYEDGVLELHSGSYFGKTANYVNTDMLVRGTVLAGTPQQPLTRDCYVGLSTSDWKGRVRELIMPIQGQQRAGRFVGTIPSRRENTEPPIHIGLMVTESGKIRVHSADPAEARIVFRWHGHHGRGSDSGTSFLNIENERQRKMWERIRGRVCAMFLGDVQLNGVVFDHFHAGGIMLADMDLPKGWQHVTFGEHNAADADELVAPIPAYLDPEDKGWEHPEWKYPDDAPVVKFVPAGNVYVKGRDTVRVTLNSDAGDGAQIRYTTDGALPEADSKLYTGPITLEETTVVKARCFRDGRRLGPPRRLEYIFHDPESLAIKPGNVTGKTAPGLIGRYYEKADRYTKFRVFEENKPGREQVVEQVDLTLSDGEPAALSFEGYLEVKRAGWYRFEAVTEHYRHIGGQFLSLTLGDTEVFGNAWFRDADGRMRQAGVAKLTPGLYRLHAKAMIKKPGFEMLWAGPQMDQQPIAADALSH
ncbi:MAG: chitobiase/beta-hexosaminidase C-terminal domain-containing protein [Phycisphaerae bacterium]|nr:chitobiase/beta-hexosaminidase C-terminal domain-containing protein [Phycisphaerae bacterium]